MGGGKGKKDEAKETATEKALAERSARMYMDWQNIYVPHVENQLLREVDKTGTAVDEARFRHGAEVDYMSQMSLMPNDVNLSSPARALLAHQAYSEDYGGVMGGVPASVMEREGKAKVEAIALGRDTEQTSHQLLSRSASYAQRREFSKVQASQIKRQALYDAAGQIAGFAYGAYQDNLDKQAASRGAAKARGNSYTIRNSTVYDPATGGIITPRR